MDELTTPEQIKAHASDYHNGAWRDYAPLELWWWVHLLRKRAGHRTDPVKRDKDAYDASNYEAMLRQHGFHWHTTGPKTYPATKAASDPPTRKERDAAESDGLIYDVGHDEAGNQCWTTRKKRLHDDAVNVFVDVPDED